MHLLILKNSSYHHKGVEIFLLNRTRTNNFIKLTDGNQRSIHNQTLLLIRIPTKHLQTEELPRKIVQHNICYLATAIPTE